MNVLIGLLVLVAAANAVPAPFPPERTLVFKYTADIKAGTIEPVPYASQGGLQATLYVKHDTSDPTLTNAYNVKLNDVKFGLYNGKAQHFEFIDTHHSIDDAVKALQETFLIVYNENGKFQGMKFLETENGWSQNIKKAIGSMLQLDLYWLELGSPVRSHSFITKENTIHGDCQVSYTVHPKNRHEPDNSFVVTKLYEPKNCTHFSQSVFDHVQCDTCYVEHEDGMSTASRRVFEMESQGNVLFLKKLVGHGVINYFPWLANSEAHYILNNQSLTLESVFPVTGFHFTTPNFSNRTLLRDISYNRSGTTYAHLSGEDLTHGRHTVNLELLVRKLRKMLVEAADYLIENHMDMKEPDWKHGQTVNRIRNTMNYLDLESIHKLFTLVHRTETEHDRTVRNIFYQTVATVGTPASCLFIRNVIKLQQVSDTNAILMLHKLPMYVKIPNVELLQQMEEIMKFESNINFDVRVAGILCFSRLIHKTFEHEVPVLNSLVDRYIQHFYNEVINEPTYYLKMVNMMAIKNIQLDNIHKFLEPIISGNVLVSEKPYHIRVQAIWAVEKTIVKYHQYGHDLLWPLFADTSLPLPLRIACYNILVKQMPDMGRFMNLYWFMVYEKNEHLYNYHVTTIQSLANSVDPCLQPVREMARKILRFTRIRTVSGPLSSNFHVDYVHPKYGFGETMRTAFIYDEFTGTPHVGSIEHIKMVARKRSSVMGIHWNINGMGEIIEAIKKELVGHTMESITSDVVLDILRKAAKDMPPTKDIHVDICITMNDDVVQTWHFNKNSWIVGQLQQWKAILTTAHVNSQNVVYDTLYEMAVPTDMGLPAVLATRIPLLTSMKFMVTTPNINFKSPLKVDIKLDVRFWQHGEYLMSIYNPIGDIWHTIRRVTSQDIVVPLDMSMSYNPEMSSIKITLPRLPVTEFSIAGSLTHAKNYVSVTEDEHDILHQTCPTCQHFEVVTKGPAYKKEYVSTYDSKDTGLRYTTGIFDCESGVTPVTRTADWLQAISPEHKYTANNRFIQLFLASRQQWMTTFISPEVGSCGTLIKSEPSIVHPTEDIDINVRFSIEDMDHLAEKMHLISGKRVNIHLVYDAKAASSNTSARLWDMNLNFDTTQGHFNNNLKVQLTRVTPGEKKLKICLDAQKNYPVITFDQLKLGMLKEETNTKITITMGMTDEEKCVRDDMLVTMVIKGEMTDEQKKQMHHEHVHGSCVKDSENTDYLTQEGHIAKTWNCIRDVLLYTTMRLYTANITYRMVPQTITSKMVMIDDTVRSLFLPHLRYTMNHVEPGHMKLTAEYPLESDKMDVSVNTPTHSYDLIELPFGERTWNMAMDHTHFTTTFLQQLLNGQARLCTVYPRTLLTADNSTIPFVVSDEWTLMSGDYVKHTYAVFGKIVKMHIMAVKIFVGKHTVEIMTTENGRVVMVDDKVVENHEKGVMVPHDATANDYVFKITTSFQHLTVQSQHVPVTVLCTPNSVSLVLDSTLRGMVTGMCGHLDYTHIEKLPKVYTTPKF